MTENEIHKAVASHLAARSAPGVRAKFEELTIPEPNSGCLLWLGAPTGPLGHGQIKINGKNRMASHVALELAGRPLPPGMFACHHCDNPACVEETHLFHGTQKQNVQDAIQKGRHNMTGLGAAHGHNALAPAIKAEAHLLYDAGLSPASISRKLGIVPVTVFGWLVEFGHKPRGKPPYTHCKYGHEFPPGRTQKCLVCKRLQRKRNAT